MATSQEKMDELLKTIEEMSVLELSEFVKALEDKFGVTAAAPVAAAAPAAAADGGGAAEEEQSEFDVILTDAGGNKIQVIKAVRELTSLGLKEAKDLVDSIPKPIREAITRDEADATKARLEEAGATVEIK